MYNNGDGCGNGGAWMSSMWGIVIFFLILFWVFSGNRNGLGNGFAYPNGYGFPGMGWGNNEHTPKDNDARLHEIKATMDKDTAVLNGNLDLGFRTVLNNADNNANKIIEYAQNQRIQQLERENTQLFITAQNDSIKNMMLLQQGQTDRRLDAIEAQMLKQPPVYPTVCVPCSSNCCGGGCGCGNA